MDIEQNEPGGLLGRTAALRRLARGILYDPTCDDDVVQEAWLLALRRTRRSTWPQAPWLAEVVRRLARNQNRDTVRRRRRERSAAMGERLPSTVDAAGRIEVLRGLVDAVGALAEPYRETILLRYFDDLPPREIARRMDVPVETVRTRTKRGLEKVRRRLVARQGDGRGSFLAALLPVAGRMPWRLKLGLPAGSASLIPWTGAVAVWKTVSLVTAAIAAALIAAFAVHVRRGSAEPAATPRRTAALEAPVGKMPAGSVATAAESNAVRERVPLPPATRLLLQAGSRARARSSRPDRPRSSRG
jgi:RNA polymerase sigma-70 factor (ECF subfamily)